MVVVNSVTSEVILRAQLVRMACGTGLHKCGRIALRSPLPREMVRGRRMLSNGTKLSATKEGRKNNLAIIGRGVTVFANMQNTVVTLTMGLKLVKGIKVVKERNRAQIQRERVIRFSWPQRKGRKLGRS
jgi:hypothetical protein